MPAQSPVACSHGDIFCRECALNNILSQKKDIKRVEKIREREEREAEDDQAREDAEAKDRSVQEFEKIQMGLEAKRGSKPTKQNIIGFAGSDNKTVIEDEAPDIKQGEKRKFELDEDELLRIAREERTKARKTLDDEKVSLKHDYLVLLLTMKPGFQDQITLFLGPKRYAHVKFYFNTA